jgi:hypothetical protein
MVKVELELEESWELMSYVVNTMLDDIKVDKSDRAKVRRWKSGEMKTGSEEMRALHEKLNEDLVRLWGIRRRSDIQRADWR